MYEATVYTLEGASFMVRRQDDGEAIDAAISLANDHGYFCGLQVEVTYFP